MGVTALKFSACIDMMYPDADFYSKFELASQNGFDAVEFWKWSNKDIDRVVAELQKNDLSFSIFNLDSEDEELSYALSRGILNAERTDDFILALRESIPVYHRLSASGMIVLIGETSDLPYERQIDSIVKTLLAAKPIVEQENITLVVEPLNSFDRKNYFLPRVKDVIEILKQVASPNIKLLFDLYHEQYMAGNIINTISDNIGQIGHFHVADLPGRHEPGTGEMNYKNILRYIDTVYNGYVGMEFRRINASSESVDYIRRIMK